MKRKIENKNSKKFNSNKIQRENTMKRNTEIQDEIQEIVSPKYKMNHDLHNFPIVEFIETSSGESNIIYWRGKLFELRDLIVANLEDLSSIFNQYKYIKIT